jgi:GT2 family glycosyltransferase
MAPSVSIIIVTYNSAPHLPACCAALQALYYDPPPQIVVVDNASHDDSVALVRRLLPTARLLPQETNHGFGGGVQIGAAASDGEILVLLNPDTVVDPGWLTALVTALDRPGCAIAGSKIYDPDGVTLRHTGGQLSLPVVLASHRGDGEPDHSQYDVAQAMPFVTGAALALRRDLWDRLGGLDIGFFPGYFEDVDLCWRAQTMGFECCYAPDSTLRHSESASTGKYSGAFYYYHHRNRLRFACKHLGWDELWADFAPAEALRLRTASALDRAVAGLVYRQALPHGLATPDTVARERILRCGHMLAAVNARIQDQPDAWPLEVQELLGLRTSVEPDLTALLNEAKAEAVLHEHQFSSGLPLVARLRRAWNSVATRWYVLPTLHQQTRFNLAAQRSLAQLERHSQCAIIETQLRQALLCYRIANDA